MRAALARTLVLAALVGVAGTCTVLAYRALAPRRDPSVGWVRAIAVARRASRLKALVPALRTREDAVARFDELARAGPPAARSQAHLLAGLLDVQNAAAQPDPRGGLARAVDELRRAIRLDRGNDDAAYDLELLLARSQQAGRPIERPKPTREHETRRRGLAPPGTGY